MKGHKAAAILRPQLYNLRIGNEEETILVISNHSTLPNKSTHWIIPDDMSVATVIKIK